MKAWTVWITGLPGSGKSTIAQALLSRLKKMENHVQILSTDMLRRVMTPKPSYSEEERENVYATVVFIAKLLNQNGVNVIIDATGNLRRYRDKCRQELENFILVYAKCPLEVCMEREMRRKSTFGAPREIYKKGLEGRSSTVPGINVPYEEPLDADIVVETNKLTPPECAEKIVEAIMIRFMDRGRAH